MFTTFRKCIECFSGRGNRKLQTWLWRSKRIERSTFFSKLFCVTEYSVLSSVIQLCPTLWDPMDCSTTGFPVHHQLLELAQTHVHWVGDAIQPSHPLSALYPPAFNLAQHQGLFQWVSSSHQMTKVLEFQLQHQSMNIQDRLPLGWTGWISFQSKRLSRVFSSTTIQKRQFFGAQLSLWYHHMTTGKTIALTIQTFVSKVMCLLFNMLSRFVI